MLDSGGVGSRFVTLIVLALAAMPGATAFPVDAGSLVAEAGDTIERIASWEPDAPPVPEVDPEVPPVPDAPRVDMSFVCAHARNVPVSSAPVRELDQDNTDEIEEIMDDAGHLRSACRDLLA